MAGGATLAMAALLVLAVVPDGAVRHSPFLSGIVTIIFVVFLIQGIACGIGTIVALMLAYTITFLIGWAIFLLAWMTLDIPVGPGAGLYLPVQAP